MIKSTAINTYGQDFIRRFLHYIVKALKQLASFRPKDLLSEDIRYDIYFHRTFIPDLYGRHAASDSSNCLFCRHLVKSVYHRHCLVCSKGTYDNCYLPFPDILFEDAGNECMFKPWYFMKTCGSFERLPKRQYSRNLHFLFSSITIRSHETLEGLENGLVSGIRPCHICASVDYDLYRRCKRQGDFDISSPCPRIKKELSHIYENCRSVIRSAG